MTPEERIDANIDAFLRSMGTSFSNYTMQSSKDRMREAMLKIMKESYIRGSNDHHDAMVEASKRRRTK